MIKIKNLNKFYEVKNQKFQILKEVSFNTNGTGMILICGDSGCGKTTLLNIISGFDRKYIGNVFINDIENRLRKKKDYNTFLNKQIGFLFQDPILIQSLTVIENVLLPTWIGESSNNKINELLDFLSISHLKNHKPNTLSVGERQRVILARAIINEGSLLLCDEPTGSLDQENSERVVQLLKKLSLNRLVVAVSHDYSLFSSHYTTLIKIKSKTVVCENLKNEITEKQNIDIIQQKKYKKRLYLFFLSFKNFISQRKRNLFMITTLSLGVVNLGLAMGFTNGMKQSFQQYSIGSFQKDNISATKKEMNSVLPSLNDVIIESMFGENKGHIAPAYDISVPQNSYNVSIKTDENQFFTLNNFDLNHVVTIQSHPLIKEKMKDTQVILEINQSIEKEWCLALTNKNKCSLNDLKKRELIIDFRDEYLATTIQLEVLKIIIGNQSFIQLWHSNPLINETFIKKFDRHPLIISSKKYFVQLDLFSLKEKKEFNSTSYYALEYKNLQFENNLYEILVVLNQPNILLNVQDLKIYYEKNRELFYNYVFLEKNQKNFTYLGVEEPFFSPPFSLNRVTKTENKEKANYQPSKVFFKSDDSTKLLRNEIHLSSSLAKKINCKEGDWIDVVWMNESFFWNVLTIIEEEKEVIYQNSEWTYQILLDTFQSFEYQLQTNLLFYKINYEKASSKLINKLNLENEKVEFFSLAISYFELLDEVIGLMKGIINVLSVTILCASILIIYIINYIKGYERKKEIGVYRVLGMQVKSLKKLMIYENLYLSFLATILGFLSLIMVAKEINLGMEGFLGNGDQTTFLHLNIELFFQLLAITTFFTWIASVLPIKKFVKKDILALIK